MAYRVLRRPPDRAAKANRQSGTQPPCARRLRGVSVTPGRSGGGSGTTKLRVNGGAGSFTWPSRSSYSAMNVVSGWLKWFSSRRPV